MALEAVCRAEVSYAYPRSFWFLSLVVQPILPDYYTHYYKNACSELCARNYHRYTRLILTLGIIRERTVWWFMVLKYSCLHDIGPAAGIGSR